MFGIAVEALLCHSYRNVKSAYTKTAYFDYCFASHIYGLYYAYACQEHLLLSKQNVVFIEFHHKGNRHHGKQKVSIDLEKSIRNGCKRTHQIYKIPNKYFRIDEYWR